MSELKLVYVLPKEKCPTVDTYHGGVMGLSPTAVCFVKTSGEVYLIDPGSIADVQVILGVAPYSLKFAELEEVRFQDGDKT